MFDDGIINDIQKKTKNIDLLDKGHREGERYWTSVSIRLSSWVYRKKKKLFINTQLRAELKSTWISTEQIVSFICRDGKLTYTLSSIYSFPMNFEVILLLFPFFEWGN